MTEKAARTPTPNQTIIENLQNETDILQTSLSEKERLLNIKENQTTKMETEVTHLKKQLSIPFLVVLFSVLLSYLIFATLCFFPLMLLSMTYSWITAF
jgi:hypothetical protein